VQHVRGTVGRWVSEEKTLASSDEQVVRNRVVIDVVIERQFAVPVAARVIFEKRIVVHEAVFGASAFSVVSAHEQAADAVSINNVFAQGDVARCPVPVFTSE